MSRRSVCCHIPASILLVGSLLWLSGCATYSDSAQFRSIEIYLAAQQPDAALNVLESRRHVRRDEVLHLLNKGMLLRRSGRLEDSNTVFETVKQLMTQLYGISIREQTTALVINDATRSYVGYEYEQVLLYIFKALNYLELGEGEKARVEVMQMDVRLRELGKAGAKVEAFGRYVAGIVFEQRREWNDAMVAYRKAYRAYKRRQNGSGVVPRFLQYDLLRLAQRQGLKNELRKYRKEFTITHWRSVRERTKLGELVFLMHNGLAPVKREHSVVSFARHANHTVRISLPYYQHLPATTYRGRIKIADQSTQSVPVEDINGLARRALERRMGVITARAIARAVIKAEMAKKAREESRKNNRPLLGFLMEVATVVTERADTRSWTTLPYNIQMVRIALPPGIYNLDAEVSADFHSAVKTRTFPDIKIEKGKYTYVNYHWVPPDIQRRR